MISFGYLDLTSTDITKGELFILFEGCKSYLYVVIFNIEEGESGGKRRTKDRFLWKNKKIRFLVYGYRCQSPSPTNRIVLNQWFW